MKTAYIWIALLTVFAVAFALYLLPTREDVYLLQSKSNEAKSAKEYYIEEYRKGNLTPDIVIPLGIIYIKEGKVEDAIQLLEDYVEAHPHDVKALQMLADLYFANQQLDHYYATVEKIEKIKDDGANLQELSGYYKNHPQELLHILEKLIQTKYADNSSYLQLAQLYAKRKEYAKVVTTLEERRKKFPDKIRVEDIFFEIWALREQKKPELDEKSVFLLRDFLLKKNDFQTTYYALGLFKQRYPSLTPLLIQEIHPLIERNSYLRTLALESLLEQPQQKEKAYQGFVELYSKNESNPLLDNLLFDLFLERNDDTRLLNLLRKTNPEEIEEQKYIALGQKALTEHKPYLAHSAQKILGELYLQSHPLVALVFQMATNEAEGEEILKRYLQKQDLDRFEIFTLFKIAAAAGYKEITLELGSRLSPYTSFSEYELIEIAAVYIQLKEIDHFRNSLMKEFGRIQGSRAEGAFALLRVSMGDPVPAKEWLAKHSEVPNYILVDFYMVAADHKEYSLALLIANRMKREYPSSLSDAYLASILAESGNIEEGLSILRDLYQHRPSPEIERMYFSALVSAFKRNPRYKKELLGYMETKERGGPISDSSLRDFGYIYLDVLHDFCKARSTFEILAYRSTDHNDDVQTAIYLWGPSVCPENIQWMVNRLRNSGCKEANSWLQDLAYVGAFECVISLFEECLACTSICNFDVKTLFAYMDALLYVDPCFFIKRREEAFLCPSARSEEIFKISNSCEKIWGMHPDTLRREWLKNTIDSFFPLMKTTEDLVLLASYSEQAEYLEGRRNLWEILASDVTTDETAFLRAWQELARAHFDERNYPKVIESLDYFFPLYLDYFCKTGFHAQKSDEKTELEKTIQSRFFESLYEYGESCYALRFYCWAWPYYCWSLQAILSACENTPLMLEIASLIHYRLSEREFLDLKKYERQAIALDWMGAFYQKTSRVSDSAAAYLNMLLDVGALCEARRFLNAVIVD